MLPVVGLHARWSKHARVETVTTILGDPDRPDASPFPAAADYMHEAPVRYCRVCLRAVRKSELVDGCGPKCARRLGLTQPAQRTANARVPRQIRRSDDGRPRPDLLDLLADADADADADAEG